MYKVQNKHVVSNNVQKHNFFYKDRMNTLQAHTCAKFKKNLTKAFGADKLVQYQKVENFPEVKIWTCQDGDINKPN